MKKFYTFHYSVHSDDVDGGLYGKLHRNIYDTRDKAEEVLQEVLSSGANEFGETPAFGNIIEFDYNPDKIAE